MDEGQEREDESSEIYFDESSDSPQYEDGYSRSARNKGAIAIVSILVLLSGGFFLLHQINKPSDILRIQGKVALTATELRSVVAAKHLTVYWSGPQAGAKYSLTSATPGVAVLRYLPDGKGLNDTQAVYRAIGTYAQKNAFAVNQSTGSEAGNIGFTNVDGNSVFYAKNRPTNVYVGMKDKDIQIEIFDPLIDQALGVALVRNQLAQIK
jgi:hypothetical protein